MSRRVVSAALVISKNDDGQDLYLYEGALLPTNVSDKEIARLDALGFLAPEGTEVTPKADITQEPDDEAPATS